jgi:hypothetical protein
MNEHIEQNVIIPRKEELAKIAQDYYPTWHRESVPKWTNCLWEIINYFKWDRNIRLFVKKSFLKWDIAKFEEEYKIIKSKFKNIIPNQWFVSVWWNIFVFCAPIWIKIDIFLDRNRQYLVELIKKEPRLLKQIKFFIKVFEELLNKWFILDLYWSENLVISDDNRLYYLDSFLVFSQNNIVKEWSLKNLEFLKEIVREVEESKK